MKRIASLAVLALLAAGCASVPKAPPELDRAAKQFRPMPGKTSLYVFRDESMGAAVRMGLALDGAPLGETAARTFLLAIVEPGPHALVSKAENEDRLEFTGRPGENVYVWQEVRAGFMSARTRLSPMDAAAAQPRIAGCEMAVGAWMPELPANPSTSTPAREPAAVPGT